MLAIGADRELKPVAISGARLQLHHRPSHIVQDGIRAEDVLLAFPVTLLSHSFLKMCEAQNPKPKPSTFMKMPTTGRLALCGAVILLTHATFAANGPKPPPSPPPPLENWQTIDD